MDPITIERAKRGDREAAAELIRALQDAWFRLCRSLLLDDDPARDATQETALRFLRDLPHFRGDSSIMTWSMGIAINVVREMRRSRGAPDAHALTIDAKRRAAAGPVESAAQCENAELIRSTLNGLTDRQREAVILRFFEDLSVEDTARAMNCAPGLSKQRCISRRLDHEEQVETSLMSELRKQLQAARRAHRATRYPLDLASELPLHKPMSIRRMMIQTGVVVTALAAVLLLVIRLAQLPVEMESPPELVQGEPDEMFVLACLPVITIPRQPENFSFAAQLPEFAFPIPSFPSPFDYDLSDLMTEENL